MPPTSVTATGRIPVTQVATPQAVVDFPRPASDLVSRRVGRRPIIRALEAAPMSKTENDRLATVKAAKQQREAKGVCHPTIRRLRLIARDYWGEQGLFAYAAYEWDNEYLYAGEIPPPLIQWALTAYGRSIGLAANSARDDKHPVITLHPSIWSASEHPWGIEPGAPFTFDVVVHELLHVYIGLMQQGGYPIGGQTSHDNAVWASEVMRMTPLLGLPKVVASPTKRKREGGRMLRVPSVEGSISMRDLSTWPYSLRPKGYYAAGELIGGAEPMTIIRAEFAR